MPKDKINGLKCVSWTYTVHAEDKIGNSIDLRHIGRFDTPTKASTYIREMVARGSPLATLKPVSQIPQHENNY